MLLISKKTTIPEERKKEITQKEMKR